MEVRENCAIFQIVEISGWISAVDRPRLSSRDVILRILNNSEKAAERSIQITPSSLVEEINKHAHT